MRRPAAPDAPQIAEVGPEDVPADNRFDTARMNSSLVVPHTELTRFRFPVIDAHSHDSYAKTPEEVRRLGGAAAAAQRRADASSLPASRARNFAPRRPATRCPTQDAS